jgi:predicted RNase H-like HicB family nuclease
MKKPSESSRTYNLWVVLHPSADLAGQWVAHSLELDVVSQGNSPEQAIEMVAEACAMVVVEDIAHGRDPLSRRAPDEFWTELTMIVNRGKQMRISEIKRLHAGAAIKAIAAQVMLNIAFGMTGRRAAVKVQPHPGYTVPFAWKSPASQPVHA